MTNFEKVKQKINQMSLDEFMETFISPYTCECCAFTVNDDDCNKCPCIYGQRKWFESEVKEDG